MIRLSEIKLPLGAAEQPDSELRAAAARMLEIGRAHV